MIERRIIFRQGLNGGFKARLLKRSKARNNWTIISPLPSYRFRSVVGRRGQICGLESRDAQLFPRWFDIFAWYAVAGFIFPDGNEDTSGELQAPHGRVLPTAWWLERSSLVLKVDKIDVEEFLKETFRNKSRLS